MTRDERLMLMAALLIGPRLASKNPVTGRAPENAAFVAMAIEAAVLQALALEEELPDRGKTFLQLWRDEIARQDAEEEEET